jgi:redox-sensitive bicupin YhaK (pirin superfamily)
MISYVDSKKMGRGIHNWLDSHFHFSFAEYYNPDNMIFGILRVINDDIVQPKMGFDTHPHKNMEIISYVVDGELTHKDSMGNQSTLTRGQVQYMSAGTGVMHSEYNLNENNILRFLQIWILTNKPNSEPEYGDVRFEFAERADKWLHIATRKENVDSDAPIKMHANAEIYATMLSANKSIEFNVAKDRQAYLVLIEGKAKLNNIILNMRDGAEIVAEKLAITALDNDAHLIIIDMEREE